jgi:hypothetical protein
MLAVIDDSINPNLRAPEAKVNFLVWYEFSQIELAPTMQAKTAKQTLDCIGLVLSVRPELPS